MLLCEVTMEVRACPDEAFVDRLPEIDAMFEVGGIPVPLILLPVGSEELVMGKGVVSLGAKELIVLLFVDDEMGDDPELGTVKELGTLKVMFVALPGVRDELVSGKGVIVLVTLAVTLPVGMEEFVAGKGVVSLPPEPGVDDMRLLVRLPVGLTTEAEEFVNGNGAVSLALADVLVVKIDSVVAGVPELEVAEDVAVIPVPNELLDGFSRVVVEFIDVKVLVISALIEPVMLVGYGVETGMDSPEVDTPVTFDCPLVGLVRGLDVLVIGYGTVSLVLNELMEPVDSGGGDTDPAPEIEVTVLLNGPLVCPPDGVDEFVRDNGVVSVTLIGDPVVVGIEFVNSELVNIPGLSIELVCPLGLVEFERG